LKLLREILESIPGEPKALSATIPELSLTASIVDSVDVLMAPSVEEAQAADYAVLWAKAANCSRAAGLVWGLVQQLPTEPAVLNAVSLAFQGNGWEILDANEQKCGLWRALYALQCVEARILPALWKPGSACAEAAQDPNIAQFDFIEQGGLDRIVRLVQRMAKEAQAEPLLLDAATTLYRLFDVLFRNTIMDDHQFIAKKAGHLVEDLVQIAKIAMPRSVRAAVAAMKALETLLTRSTEIIENEPALGAGFVFDAIVVPLLPCIDHAESVVRRSVGKCLKLAADMHRRVAAPLLQTLAERIFDFECQHDAMQLLSSVLSSVHNADAARQVVSFFAKQIGTDVRRTLSGAALLKWLLCESDEPSMQRHWRHVLGDENAVQWLETCILVNLPHVPDARPFGSEDFRPNPQVVGTVSELLCAMLKTGPASKLVRGLATSALAFLEKVHLPKHTSWPFEWIVDPGASVDLCLPGKPRSDVGYVGLRNHGNTCYLNAVVQQLFFLPPCRSLVLGTRVPNLKLRPGDICVAFAAHESASGRVPERPSFKCKILKEPKDEKVRVLREDRSEVVIPTSWLRLNITLDRDEAEQGCEQKLVVLRELQRVFWALSEGSSALFDPLMLVRATNHALKLEFDANNQNDASEFFDKLVEVVSEQQRKLELPLSLESVLEGKLVKCKKCHACGAVTKVREETFLSLGLACKSEQKELSSLEECLEHWSKAETMMGDNRVECDMCKAKTDTTLWQVLSELPDYLVLHVERFAFDLQTLENEKLHHRVAFPKELDLGRFTAGPADDSLSPRKQAQASVCGELRDLGSKVYDLVGVTVHSGSCGGGHYYAYLTQNEKDWFELNDEVVSRFDAHSAESGIEAECFGQSAGRARGRRSRASAYLLVYAKRDRKRDLSVPAHVPQDREFWANRDFVYRQQVVHTKMFLRLCEDIGTASLCETAYEAGGVDTVCRFVARAQLLVLPRVKDFNTIHGDRWMKLLEALLQRVTHEGLLRIVDDWVREDWLTIAAGAPGAIQTYFATGLILIFFRAKDDLSVLNRFAVALETKARGVASFLGVVLAGDLVHDVMDTTPIKDVMAKMRTLRRALLRSRVFGHLVSWYERSTGRAEFDLLAALVESEAAGEWHCFNVATALAPALCSQAQELGSRRLFHKLISDSSFRLLEPSPLLWSLCLVLGQGCEDKVEFCLEAPNSSRIDRERGLKTCLQYGGRETRVFFFEHVTLPKHSLEKQIQLLQILDIGLAVSRDNKEPLEGRLCAQVRAWLEKLADAPGQRELCTALLTLLDGSR